MHDRGADVTPPSPLEELGGLCLDLLQCSLLEGDLLLDLLRREEGEGEEGKRRRRGRGGGGEEEEEGKRRRRGQ